MAHFQMSTGGSKSNEHVDHFLVDIHIQGRNIQLKYDFKLFTTDI